jgi:hypothetical protein
MSYLSQKATGNAFFFNTLFFMTNHKQDKFLWLLHNYYLGRAIELYLSKPAAEQIVLQGDNSPVQLLLLLPDHDVFALFMALHIYLYLQAQQQADTVVDVTRMACDHGYRTNVEEEVRDRSKLPIRLSDIADVQQFNCMDVDAIDWQEISDHAGLAVSALSNFYPLERLQQSASDIIAATAAEMRLSEKYLRGARLHAAALLTENRKIGDAHRALAGELDAAIQARDTALAERARISQERDALAGGRDQILRQLDAVIVERDELSRQRDGLADDCATIAAERDRAVAERDKLADESRRWFEATIAVGAAAGFGGAMPGGARKSILRSRLRELGTISQWRQQKRLIASARCASAAHKWEFAARYYSEAINCAPHNPALWVQYGHALREAGKLEAGEYAYRRSLECDDRIADTHLQLAHVLALQNRPSEASESLLRSLRLEPHLHDAIYGLLALGWTTETLRSELQGD